MWIVHGSADTASPVESDRTIYQSILDAGGTQVKYTEYPGLDHVPAIEQARTDPAFLEWLFAQRRKQGGQATDRCCLRGRAQRLV
jgi:predicted peptidase